jgi:hypothetical protein
MIVISIIIIMIVIIIIIIIVDPGWRPSITAGLSISTPGETFGSGECCHFWNIW